MARSVQPELASCQYGDPCWCHLAHFFTGALSSFPFFLTLASPPNTFWFTLRGGGEERPGFPAQPAACAAALCLVPTFALTATEQSLGDPSAPCTPPSTHLGHGQNPHPNSFSLTDFWCWFGVFFFLLKMYPYTYIWIHYEILLVKNKQMLCFVRYRLLHYLFAAFLTIPDFSILLPFSLLLAICLQKQNRQAW